MAVNNYVLSNKAKKDLEDIFHYISEELVNPESAKKLIQDLDSKFHSIIDYPYAYPLVKESRLSQEDVRKCTLHNYLIVYIVDEILSHVEIVRVIYQRMNVL